MHREVPVEEAEPDQGVELGPLRGRDGRERGEGRNSDVVLAEGLPAAVLVVIFSLS